MATTLQLLQVHGLDFAMFTPFTEDEAKAVLRLSGSEYLQAKRDGALTCSVTMHSDPLGRLRFHSLWNLVECAARIDAGWPRVPLDTIDEDVLEASENILLSLFDDKRGSSTSASSSCRSFPSPDYCWHAHQRRETYEQLDVGLSTNAHGDVIARTTLNAFWKTLHRVNDLIRDRNSAWMDHQSDPQLSMKL